MLQKVPGSNATQYDNEMARFLDYPLQIVVPDDQKERGCEYRVVEDFLVDE
jgi:hypothetical protein